MKNVLRISSVLALSALISMESCKKDDTEPAKPVVVPATYAFENMDYSASTARVNMLVSLNNYLKNSTTAALDQSKVDNMFNNTNNPFGDPTLDGSGKSLVEKMADATIFKGHLDKVVTYSQSYTTAANDGTAGTLVDGTKKYLVGPDGVEYAQVVQKGIMGSLFFKEAMNILTNIGGADNNTVVTGSGTAMMHNWDEAFGYLGIPVDYDSSKTYASTDAVRPLLWGGYLAEHGKPLQAGGKLFEAFRKGRAAIVAKNYTVRDSAVRTIQETWEQLAAISAYDYFLAPQSSASVGHLGAQFHNLSECYGFVLALKYRPANSKLSASDYNTLVNIITTNSLYDLVNEPGFTKLNQAATILKNSYGF